MGCLLGYMDGWNIVWCFFGWVDIVGLVVFCFFCYFIEIVLIEFFGVVVCVILDMLIVGFFIELSDVFLNLELIVS